MNGDQHRQHGVQERQPRALDVVVASPKRGRGPSVVDADEESFALSRTVRVLVLKGSILLVHWLKVDRALVLLGRALLLLGIALLSIVAGRWTGGCVGMHKLASEG